MPKVQRQSEAANLFKMRVISAEREVCNNSDVAIRKEQRAYICVYIVFAFSRGPSDGFNVSRTVKQN